MFSPGQKITCTIACKCKEITINQEYKVVHVFNATVALERDTVEMVYLEGLVGHYRASRFKALHTQSVVLAVAPKPKLAKAPIKESKMYKDLCAELKEVISEKQLLVELNKVWRAGVITQELNVEEYSYPLESCFLWHETPQGLDFWNNLYLEAHGN